jgi:hypothetical protein
MLDVCRDRGAVLSSPFDPCQRPAGADDHTAHTIRLRSNKLSSAALSMFMSKAELKALTMDIRARDIFLNDLSMASDSQDKTAEVFEMGCSAAKFGVRDI